VGDSTVALNIALIADRLDEDELAVDAFADAVAWDPALAGSSIWEAYPAVKDAVIETARGRVDPYDAALILAYGGRPDEARTELEALPDSSRRIAYLAATEWLGGDPAAALARLQTQLQRNPGDWYVAGWASRIARRSNDAAAADRYFRWALAVQADAAPSVILEHSLVPASFDAESAGVPGSYPWAVYLRATPPYLLMPELATIGVR
jgi:tetratricopeptide (TPR) repeat protein